MASKTYEIAFKLAGKMSGNFASTFKNANNAVKSFNGRLNDLNKQASKIDSVVKLRKETGEAARTYIQAKQKVEQLGRAISKTQNPTKEMTAEFNKAKSAVEKAKTSLDKKKNALKLLENQVGTTGSSLKTLITRQNELKTSADRARRAQEKLAQTNEKIQKINEVQGKLKSGAASSAGALAGIGATVGAAGAATVLPAIQMEDAMAEVRKVTDFTPEGLEKTREALEQMSTKIPLSADGLAQIMASAAQSGVAQKDLLGFTEQAAKMGVAFDITAEEAGTMMAKWQSGMGLSQEQTYKLADAVNALSNVNAATAPQIGEVLKRYGALGKVAGLTEKETAAFAASVVASGAESEVAATGIKAFMRAMGKGGSMSKKQAAAFSNVGLNPKELQKNLQKDAPQAIISTLEAIQKAVPKEKWNQYLSVMFGEEAAVAVGPMMSNLEGLKENFKMVGDEANYSGSMLNEFKARSETTSNALTLAKNAATYAARAIGQPLLQPLKELSAEFVQGAMKVADWIKNNQELVMKILKVVGVVLGAVTAFHAIRMAIAFVISPLLSLYKGFMFIKSAVTMASLTFGIATSTIWIIIGAIAAAIAIGVLLWKNWDKIKAKCSELWVAFQEKFPGIANVVKNTYEHSIKPVIDGIKKIFGGLIDFIAGIFTGNWSRAWEGVKNIFKGVWESFKGIAKAPLNAVISMVNGVIGGLNKLDIKIPDWVPKWGGKSFGINIPKIPHLAEGGVATRPTLAMIGEGRESEAVLPLSKLRAMLGGNGVGGSISVNFAPTINVSGGGGSVSAEIERGLKAGQQSLKKELEKLLQNQRRLSYV